ncbi:MAG: hypothetical protein Q9186_006838, partial [Xanthomendoza sp. 1 TL-2023]
IWDAIKDGTIYSCPSLLASFLVLSYADLKKYRFTYLFGFPALHSEPLWRVTASLQDSVQIDAQDSTVADLAVHLSGIESTALVESVQTWRYGVDARQYGFFLAKKLRKLRSNEADEGTSDDGPESRPITPEASTSKLDYSWVVGPLAKYETGFFDGVECTDRFVCFADPSTYNEYPGWMLRNLLILVSKRWGLDKVQILCYRDIHQRREDARSIIMRLTRDEQKNTPLTANEAMVEQELPRVSGWERSAAGKISSKIANLGEYMNPQRYKKMQSRTLADQAVDLNLKLIKWRISPGLNLDVIKETKCLLLGAGTLGSYVARNLLVGPATAHCSCARLNLRYLQGWGVRKITFVDNGSVSFSNPVRQPLFSFEDCLHGGAKKAYRAAQALKEIYPGVDAEGHFMAVPMAGHPIIDEPTMKKEYETLMRLIQEHDAIFLLMDTRESRWLPTVMGKAAGKVVMNAALGFDSFVVMRHGMHDPTQPEQGLGGQAPAPTSPHDDRGDHPLGVVPHQLRGFLSTFQNLVIKGNSYDCCSACSPQIIGAYNSDQWQFVKRALNEKGYVEELSGLAEVQRTAEKAMAEIDISDDSDVVDDEEVEIIQEYTGVP